MMLLNDNSYHKFMVGGLVMGGTLVVLILLFTPVLVVASFIYLSKRQYERAHLRRKAKYTIKRRAR